MRQLVRRHLSLRRDEVYYKAWRDMPDDNHNFPFPTNRQRGHIRHVYRHPRRILVACTVETCRCTCPLQRALHKVLWYYYQASILVLITTYFGTYEASILVYKQNFSYTHKVLRDLRGRQATDDDR